MSHPKSLLQRLILPAVLAAAWLVPRAAGQVTVSSSSATFSGSALLIYGPDPAGDMQATRRSVDLVGDASLPVFTVAADANTLFFRFRLNAPASGANPPGSFDQVAIAGIDIDGTGWADIAFGVAGKGGQVGGNSYFMRFGESGALPLTVDNWGKPYGLQPLDSSGADADFNYSLVAAVDGPVGDVPGSHGPNTFLTFAVSFDRLQEAIQALGGGYSAFQVNGGSVTGFGFSGHTATQSNIPNVDVLGDGHIIPEIPTAAFLAVALLPLALFRARAALRLRRGDAG